MVERWKVQGSGRWIHGLEVSPLIRQRIQRGIFETRFVSDHDRILSFLNEGNHVKLTLMNADDDTEVVQTSSETAPFSMEGLHTLVGTPTNAPIVESMPLEDALAVAATLVLDGDWTIKESPAS